MASKSGSPPPPYKDPNAGIIARGAKGPSPAGTLTFIGLRSVDPLLQYQILAHGLGASFLSRLGLSMLPLSPAVVTRTGIRLADQLGLPLERLLLLGMAVGCAVKHAFWVTYLSQEQFSTRGAVVVSALTTLMNSVNSLLLLIKATSAALSTRPFRVSVPGTGARLSLPVALGTLLFILGLSLETGSEWQRKQFKDNPENKGKLCRGGLWNWARHINYGGFTLWKTGYALAAGGWLYAVATGLVTAWRLKETGMVSLDYYMSRRYKDQWGRYKEDVTWRLLPGVF